MSNWDDFIYLGGEDIKVSRKVYLNFCIPCGRSYNIRGSRYLVAGAHGPVLLLDKADQYECPHCQFPIFTACNYKKITKAG